jgi:cation diffusion facilitator family transporter
MEARNRKARFGAWTGIVANLGLAAVKFAVGLVCSSAALVADGVHSLSDSISSLIVLVGLKVASAPPDKEHPYGHGKAEAVAAKVVAVMLVVLAAGVGYRAIAGLVHHGALRPPDPLALYVALGSMLAKELLYRYKIRLGRSVGSMALEADAWHHRSDALSSGVAALGIAGSILGGGSWHALDEAAALVIAVTILVVGVQQFRKSSHVLMDGMVSGERVLEIREVAATIDGVLGVEVVRARRSGLGMLVDIHIEVNPGMTVEGGHDVASRVRDALTRRISDVEGVLVHIEPYYPDGHDGPGIAGTGSAAAGSAGDA